MALLSVPRLADRRAKASGNPGDLIRWQQSIDDKIEDILRSLKQVVDAVNTLLNGIGASALKILVTTVPSTTMAETVMFAWPHILSDQLQLLPGGLDIGRGAEAIVNGIEGYFETAPSSLDLQIMNGSADASPATITVTTNYFSNFGLTKKISAGNKMFIKLNTAPNGAEFLMYCRPRYHKPA